MKYFPLKIFTQHSHWVDKSKINKEKEGDKWKVSEKVGASNLFYDNINLISILHSNFLGSLGIPKPLSIK